MVTEFCRISIKLSVDILHMGILRCANAILTIASIDMQNTVGGRFEASSERKSMRDLISMFMLI